MNLFQRSLKDYLSPKFLGLSFAVLFIPLILLGILLIFGGGELLSLLAEGVESGNFEQIGIDEHPILFKILQFGVVQWLIATFFYALGGLFAVLLSLIIAMVVLGFLTPFVVKNLHEKYYQDSLREECSTGSIMKMMFVVILKFIVLFILCLPFIFVPFAINVPFAYLFYKFLVIDVGSNILNQNDLKIFEKRYFLPLAITSIGFFALSMIPIIGIFLQLFFVIYFTHFFFEKK